MSNIKKVVLTIPIPSGLILASEINWLDNAVLVRQNGILKGMVIREDRGWIVRNSGGLGMYGHWGTLEKCINEGIKLGFEFYVED